MTPILLTLDTNPNDRSLLFIKTLTNNNWPFRLIGTDDKWVNFLYRVIQYKIELEKLVIKNEEQI